MTIQAIETEYNGYRFRSRLEARWAVFFDTLGIKYEYEPQGFKLASGTRYLPDFLLPTFNGGMWCEVKYKGGDLSKAIDFARQSKRPIWICEGPPSIAIYKFTMLDYACTGPAPWEENYNKDECDEDCPACRHYTPFIRFICGIPNWDQAADDNRMFTMPCGLCRYGDGGCDGGELQSPHPLTVPYHELEPCDLNGQLKQAVEAAKQARFERGQVGAPSEWD